MRARAAPSMLQGAAGPLGSSGQSGAVLKHLHEKMHGAGVQA